jgi:hypothetical protein
VHVVDASGGAVTYAESAVLRLKDAERKDAWTVDEVELALLDEQARPKGAIRGDQILEIRQQSVGYTVVDDTVVPEPGQTVRSRGL